MIARGLSARGCRTDLRVARARVGRDVCVGEPADHAVGVEHHGRAVGVHFCQCAPTPSSDPPTPSLPALPPPGMDDRPFDITYNFPQLCNFIKVAKSSRLIRSIQCLCQRPQKLCCLVWSENYITCIATGTCTDQSISLPKLWRRRFTSHKHDEIKSMHKRA